MNRAHRVYGTWLLLCAVASILLAPFAHAAGDWPEPRQNRQLTAMQSMPGMMAEAPVEIARYDLGRHAPALTYPPNAGETAAVALVHGALQGYDEHGDVRWTTHPEGINFEAIAASRDLDGDGRTDLLLKAGRPTPPYGAALLVDAETGRVRWRYDVDPMSYAWYLQAQRLTPGATTETIVVCMMGYPPDPENGYIALFDPTPDGATQRWRYDFDQYTCFPTLHYPDLNNDGVNEVAVQTHSRLWVFNAATGAKTQFLQWDVSPANVRSYGRVEFTDLDNDGDQDFLCLADFAQHHEVLRNNDGTLEKAWHYGWDESVTTGKVVSTWPEPPYADVDGDGALELVVSMYNGDGANRWRIRVYNVTTGAIEYSVYDAVAASLVDGNDDGAAEILANRSTDPLQSVFHGAIVFETSPETGNLTEVWRNDGATALKGVQSGSGTRSRNSDGYTIPLYGDEALVVRNSDGLLQLIHEGGEWRTVSWQAPAPAAASTPSINPPAVIGNAPPQMLAADLTHDGRNDVLFYAAGKAQIVQLHEGTLEPVGEVESSILPAIADLNGDGNRDLITAAITNTGPPRVRATSGVNGDTLWEVTLPAPDRSGLPQPRLGYLRAGRFTGRDGDDLYLYAGAPLVRSVVLSGADGSIVWERGEIPDSERYWAPTVNEASVYDYDKDGAEDIVFTNPDYYCIASGRTGELLLGPAFPPKIFDQPSQGLYTLPAVLPREGASPLVAIVAGHYFQGVMTADAQPRWHRVPLVGEHAPNHEGFLKTKEGQWVMGYGRQDGRFDAINIADGSIRWSLALNASASGVIACDMDGDGRYEFLLGTSHGELIAVGDGTDAPRVLWRYRPCTSVPLYTPIAADITGDGAVELGVPCGAGHVHMLGAPTSP